MPSKPATKKATKYARTHVYERGFDTPHTPPWTPKFPKRPSVIVHASEGSALCMQARPACDRARARALAGLRIG
jgi:hypothetical protein